MKMVFKGFGLAAAVLSLAACDVDQTQEGDIPDVDVNVSGGQMPQFDVDTPTVNVGTENKTIGVPTLEVEPAKDDNKE